MNIKKISMLIAMLMILVATGFAQQPAGSIKGKIITADNKPAEGVTILVKNTVKNDIADNDGSFEIKNLQPGKYTLLVSLVGYKDAEQEVKDYSRKKDGIQKSAGHCISRQRQGSHSFLL